MRSRSIRVTFWKNEKLAECSPWTRLLFQGLWCMADFNGTLEYRPRLIKSEIFPYDEVDVVPMLKELENRFFIVIYEQDEKTYINIPSWSKHAKPHPKEPTVHPLMRKAMVEPVTFAAEPVTLPAMPGKGSAEPETLPASPETFALTPLSLILNPLILNPNSLPPENGVAAQKPISPHSPEGLAQAWLFYLKGRSPGRDEFLEKSTEFFGELIAQKVSGEKMLAEIKGPRDRSEYPWQFKKRMLKIREPTTAGGRKSAIAKIIGEKPP